MDGGRHDIDGGWLPARPLLFGWCTKPEQYWGRVIGYLFIRIFAQRHDEEEKKQKHLRKYNVPFRGSIIFLKYTEVDSNLEDLEKTLSLSLSLSHLGFYW